MAGEEYVVRMRMKGTGVSLTPYATEEDARVSLDDYLTKWGEDVIEHTVHKLGPAIDPPEPREWVVYVDRSSGISQHISSFNLLTRSEAEELAKFAGGRRIGRIVFEDGAA